MSTPPPRSSSRSGSAAAVTPAFRRLIADAAAVDGQRAFNDQTLLTLGTDDGPLLLEVERDGQLVGAATLRDGDAELVVAPAYRRGGIGTALVGELIDRSPEGLAVWAHGDSPGAAALARTFDFDRARTLLKLRAPIADVHRPWTRTDLVLSTFDLDRDGTDWVALNARAFASHPEQGRQTLADVTSRSGEPWFAGTDFLLARTPDGTLVGFCWLKVEDGEGEIYVLGVDPDRSGAGIGRSLLAAGLDRLRERGVSVVSLYVEADNHAAVRLYRSEGFTDETIDVHYRRSGAMPR
ncbi:mycothiol synthase [Planctomonas psychrotolerans]|uniref:mycothiol synthase n=1 Tax=Planctomonas psychrotolerans TaxID=2528712 RepID=UPI00123BE206|nr:mycothiol synthase [Planctomonas psychrotolerans]